MRSFDGLEDTDIPAYQEPAVLREKGISSIPQNSEHVQVYISLSGSYRTVAELSYMSY